MGATSSSPNSTQNNGNNVAVASQEQWNKAWTVFHQPSQRRAWTTTLIELRPRDFEQKQIPADRAPQTRALAVQLGAHACTVNLGDDVVRHPPSCLWLVCATLAHIARKQGEQENDDEYEALSSLVAPTKVLVRRVFASLDWTTAIAHADKFLADLSSSEEFAVSSDLASVWDFGRGGGGASGLLWALLEMLWSDEPALVEAIGETSCVRADVTDAPQGTCSKWSSSSPNCLSGILTPQYIDQCMSWLQLFVRQDYSLMSREDVHARLHQVNFYELLEAFIGDDGASLVVRCKPLYPSMRFRSDKCGDNKTWLTDAHPRNSLVMLVYVLYRLNLFLAPPALFPQLIEICVAWPDSWREFGLVTDDWFRLTKRVAFVYQSDLVANMRAFFNFFVHFEASLPGVRSSLPPQAMTPRLVALQHRRATIPVSADDVYRGTWQSHLHLHEQRRVQQAKQRAQQEQRVFARHMPVWYAQWLSIEEFSHMSPIDQKRRDMQFHSLGMASTLHAIVDACQANVAADTEANPHQHQQMQAFLRLLQDANACSERESVRAVRHPLMALWCWILASMFHVDFSGVWLLREADRDVLARDLFQQLMARPTSLVQQVDAAHDFWVRYNNNVRIRPRNWVPTPESISFEALAVLVQIAARSVQHWPASMCRCAPFPGRRVQRREEENVYSIDEQMARVQTWLSQGKKNRTNLTLEQRVMAQHLRKLNLWDVYCQLGSGGPYYADPAPLLRAQDLFERTHSIRHDNEQDQLFFIDDKAWLEPSARMPNMLVLTTLVLYRASVASNHLADDPALVHRLALADECIQLLHEVYLAPEWDANHFLRRLSHIAPEPRRPVATTTANKIEHRLAFLGALANLMVDGLARLI